MLDPQQEFERQIAPQKVALFERQFGKNYRLLAYHAALPLVLTPELVHYLRTQFLLDRVPWEAEADLLLSGLCSQVGYELYAMNTAVRSYLLEQMAWDACIPSDRMYEVAQVLMSYVMYLSRLHPKHRERELQVQRWAAMAYLGDEQCRQMADEIAQQFEASAGHGSSTAVKAEFARLAKITQELEPQLQAYPELVEFAKRVGKVFRSPETLTTEELQQVVRVGDHRLQLPREWWNNPELKVLTFRTATLRAEGEAQPTDLQPFEFVVATIQRNSTQRQRSRKGQPATTDWVIQRQNHSAYHFLEPLAPNEDIFLDMVAIPGGGFLMGSPENEPDRFSDESPQHDVTIEPFLMARTPITQPQWRFVATQMPQVNGELTPDPSRFKGESLPVERVSWYDAVEFCARLSAHTGRTYRLPSEAEWEYACRAGTTTPFHFGETISSELANYDATKTYNGGPKGESRQKTTPVDHFEFANAWGLSDMHGNVWEWCQDHWHDNYEGAPTDGSAWLSDNEDAARVLRGGSWYYDPGDCRSATRFNDFPRGTNFNIGFRIVCSSPRALS